MRTFLSGPSARKDNSTWNQGLSLIEVLVTLMIASLLYVSVSSPSPSERKDLDRAMDTVEKVINYSINESILRNRITRTKFDLTEAEPKITVEFGSDHEFVLPDIAHYDDKSLMISEQEAKERLTKKVDSKFKVIEEIDPERLKLPNTVQILGIASSLRPTFIVDDQTAIYVYPTGERDRALIVFAVYEQVAWLTIEPYTGEFKRQYMEITAEKDLEREHARAVEKILTDWSQ